MEAQGRGSSAAAQAWGDGGAGEVRGRRVRNHLRRGLTAPRVRGTLQAGGARTSRSTVGSPLDAGGAQASPMMGLKAGP